MADHRGTAVLYFEDMVQFPRGSGTTGSYPTAVTAISVEIGEIADHSSSSTRKTGVF
ncbi:hypothetical protein GQF01_07470 [Paenibacillus sp. 5J-6]|uniref:Uncharacterized protein n=1 Tax=Paenibacillus silvestris TaxID=2606219 RepID=A0A6L8UVT1_9BACL|nr:hypothetical protein [Paenibacillus silvestris]MZQ81974.1 hypothetical protein [Paenibacillus silvestris]